MRQLLHLTTIYRYFVRWAHRGKVEDGQRSLMLLEATVHRDGKAKGSAELAVNLMTTMDVLQLFSLFMVMFSIRFMATHLAIRKDTLGDLVLTTLAHIILISNILISFPLL